MVETNNWHVFPVNDLKGHDTSGLGCECNPMLEKEGDAWIVVHRSYDRRENDEVDEITKDVIS